MTLLIWTSTPRHKVLSVLSPVLKTGVEDVQLAIVEKPPAEWAGINPAVVFALGSGPLTFLAENKIVPKNRTITSLRGQVLKLGTSSMGQVPLLLSYSPGVADNGYSHYIDLLTDFSAAIRFYRTGSNRPVYGKYRYVPDFTELVARIEKKYAETNSPVNLALDLETIGLDEFAEPAIDHPGAYIVTIQFTVDAGAADVVRFESRKHEEERLSDMEFATQMAWLLSSPKISMRGANLKFDLRWLAQRGKFECTNFKFDTTLVGSLLDENRSNGLDVHAKIYVPALAGYSDEFDKSVDKSRMDLVPPTILLPYAGGDTDATYQVADAEKVELLKDKRLTSFYVNILHPAARSFENVERGGILIDREAFRELEADLNTEILTLVAKAKQIVGGRIVAKHQDLDKIGGLNITKASMLTDFMFSPMGLNLKPKQFTEKSGAPSTAMEHLMTFKDVPEAKEFVSLLSDYASAAKTLQTYVIGFLSHLRSDGRFHPSFWFFAGNKDEGDGGTTTGRLSCKGPAWQCLSGDSLVKTDAGLKRIDWLVENRGAGLTVLTHTGNWKTIVGTYVNGVQPVFRLRFSNGYTLKATGNHPVLTKRGWVRTDQLTTGETCYADQGFWNSAPDSGVHQQNLPFVDSNEESLPVSNEQGLETVWGSRNKSVPRVAGLHKFPQGYGGASAGNNSGEEGRKRGLLCKQLHLGDSESSVQQSTQHQVVDPQWCDSERSGMGSGSWNQQGKATLQAEEWDADGAGSDEREAPSKYFQEVTLTAIESAGEEMTYDLTIRGSHSFVANGMVVHNTVPKHTKWAKRLRKCYPAPDGYVVVERDYSQGELRVVACIANEANMIKAYQQGQDLHALTSGRFSGYDYQEMMALKKADKDRYDAIRQLGKAGNFGLLYGMGVEGFHTYAVENYGVKDLTLEAAAAFREGFFETYPNLIKYHEQYKAMARMHSVVYSPLGRARHLPLINSSNRMEKSKAERQSINSPVQSTLSDMLIWTMALEEAAGLTKVSPAFGAVHDATYTYMPEDQVDILIPQHLEIMESLPFHKVGWNPQLPFIADAKFGKNMAELKEFKR